MANISQVTLPDNNTYDIKAKELASQSKTISNVAIASFSDGADNVPVSELIVDIEAEQDLHGYDKPWAGGAGKNLIDYLSCTGVGERNGTESSYGNNTSISGNVLTITQTYISNGGILKGIQHPSIVEGTTFTVSFEAKCTGDTVTVGYGKYAGGGTNQIENKDVTANTWTTISKTFTAQGDDVALFIQPSYNETTLEVRNLQLEIGSTATDYVPYSNICPITGFDSGVITRCGKNLYNTNNQTKTQNNTYCNMYLPVNSDITFSTNTVQTGLYASYYDNGNWVEIKKIYNTQTLTFNTGNHNYIRLMTFNYKDDEQSTEFQAEFGTTATAYEPYTDNTYTVDFGRTVYGGVYDANSGKISLTWFSYLAKDINWVMGNRNFADTGRIFYYRFTTNQPKIRANCLCDILKNAETYQGRWENMNVNEMQIDYSQRGQICVDVDTIAELKTLFDNSVFTYELATPIEIDVTPVQVKTLLGNNNIFADTGNIEKLVYFKTGCESITDIINVMHDDSKMSYSNVYFKKTCDQLTDPGIYYNINPTGSPAEGYLITTLITTYNCQILVHVGLVVNTRRVNRVPGGTITFSSWRRLANEEDLDGAVIPYNAEYSTTNTIYDEIEELKQRVKNLGG